MTSDTLDHTLRTEDSLDWPTLASPVPGVVLVFSRAEPVYATYAVGPEGVAIGRNLLPVDDPLISRQHARITYRAGTWCIEDLGSRNGTWVDGRPVKGDMLGAFRTVRVGSSLFLLVDDVRPYEQNTVSHCAGAVVGVRLRETWDSIRRCATSSVLHITGETGSGKELAARTYHLAGPKHAGPFVAVNCAAIPHGLAERLLFGTVRGAFSDAHADAEGYIQAAHGGTLFLDEVGELDAAVQAKLLRVIETREVQPLGASRGTPVDLRICSATHCDLRALVASGEFREDLYFRLAPPLVTLPPLRERLDEVPHLVGAAVASVDKGLRAHVTLVEACLLRPWAGNVRELIAEVAHAARQADPGRGWVKAASLAPAAGVCGGSARRGATGAPSTLPEPAPLPPRERIVLALQRHGGTVTRAARALGIHRNQLRRWLKTQNINPRSFARPDPTPMAN